MFSRDTFFVLILFCFLMFLIRGWLDLDGMPVEARVLAGCPPAKVQLFFDFFFYAVC